MTIRDELSNTWIRSMQDLFHHSETRQLVNLDCFSCSLNFQFTNVLYETNYSVFPLFFCFLHANLELLIVDHNWFPTIMNLFE